VEHPRMMDPSPASNANSPERPFIPRLEGTSVAAPHQHHVQTTPILEPRAPQREQSQHSMSTMGRSTDMSRLHSGLFQEDEEDSCVYMLGGEVVMRRGRSRDRSSSPSSHYSANADVTPRRRTTSSSDDQIPLEVETSPIGMGVHSFDSDLTPRIGSSRTSAGRREGPAFPF
jgi:hypothetical protein